MRIFPPTTLPVLFLGRTTRTSMTCTHWKTASSQFVLGLASTSSCIWAVVGPTRRSFSTVRVEIQRIDLDSTCLQSMTISSIGPATSVRLTRSTELVTRCQIPSRLTTQSRLWFTSRQYQPTGLLSRCRRLLALSQSGLSSTMVSTSMTRLQGRRGFLNSGRSKSCKMGRGTKRIPLQDRSASLGTDM